MDLERIRKKVDKKDVVSFDIFDTLILRNTYEPTDIFRIMSKEISKKYPKVDFLKLRTECEANSRCEENKYETTLDEIYDLIGKREPEIDVDKIKKRELELELEFMDVNPFMKKIFDYALKNKKKVILISDMYLSSNVIRGFLKKVGYKDVPIYVSCEQHGSKGTTELYEIVLEKEGLDKNKWVHFGDNRVSDYEKAKEFGIEAVLCKNVRSEDKLDKPKSIEARIMRGIQNNYLYSGAEVAYWEKFGVLYASPIYYGFTNWLFELTKDKDNLFFLARDGYIIKKVYDMFKEKYKVKIDTHYLYCSRKSFQLPALLHKTKDETISFLSAVNDSYDYKVTIGDILKNLDLEYEKYKDTLKVFGFKKKTDTVGMDCFYNIKGFLKYIYDDIETELKSAEKKVLKYLKQEGLLGYEKVNIMDVGWGGSIQESIALMTGKQVFGYYFGTIPTNKVDILSNSLGYAFDEAMPNNRYAKIFDIPMMYEFVFSAPHGTTVKLEEKNSKIVAVLDDDEDYADKVKCLQEAAIGLIEKYLVYAEYLEDISVDECLANYQRMIERRDYEDLIEFAELSNSVIYTNNKNMYLDSYEEDYIFAHYDEFLEKIHRAMWKDAYIVQGIEEETQWNNHKKKLEAYLGSRAVAPLRKRDYIKKGVRHPGKAIRVIKNRIAFKKS